MDMMLMMGFGIGLAALVLLAMAFKPQAAPSIGKRLEGLQNAKAKPVVSLRDQEVMSQSLVVRVVLPLADKLSKKLSGITPQGAVGQCNKLIQEAGLSGKVNAGQIITIGWVLFLALPALFYILTSFNPSRSTTHWMIIVISAVVGYRLPFMLIGSKAKARKHEIQKSLAFTLDLISISVEAGMAFDGAMAIVAEKTRGPLTDELNLTLREIRLGKSRNQALIDMGERVGVDDLKSFLTAVTYIARLGGSLVDVIRIQSNAMRVKRRQRAEEKAMKTPVKIMIPLVLFIFPSMFIVILGPAGITLLGEFSKSAVGKGG
jgi:tight adherence protein C